MNSEDRMDFDAYAEVWTRSCLESEKHICNVRWLILGFLFLYINLLNLPGWPVKTFNLVIAGGCVYNLLILRQLERTGIATPRLCLTVMYLDLLSVTVALFFTGGVQSPFLFVLYLLMFVSGVRLGIPRSLALLIPVWLIFMYFWYNDPALTGREGLNRLAVGLFSFVAALLLGAIFGREEKQTLSVMANIHRDSVTDRLTGLFNYSYFIDRLRSEHSRAERMHSQYSLILFDLDFFKQVNDTYGHEKGNVLLKEVARLVKASARKMDTVARYGGEEFVILMPDSSSAAMEAAERIRRKIEEAEFSGVADQPMKITISGGICTYPRDARSVDELLDKADKALYDAKTLGRNRIHYCSMAEWIKTT